MYAHLIWPCPKEYDRTNNSIIRTECVGADDAHCAREGEGTEKERGRGRGKRRRKEEEGEGNGEGKRERETEKEKRRRKKGEGNREGKRQRKENGIVVDVYSQVPDSVRTYVVEKNMKIECTTLDLRLLSAPALRRRSTQST